SGPAPCAVWPPFRNARGPARQARPPCPGRARYPGRDTRRRRSRAQCESGSGGRRRRAASETQDCREIERARGCLLASPASPRFSAPRPGSNLIIRRNRGELQREKGKRKKAKGKRQKATGVHSRGGRRPRRQLAGVNGDPGGRGQDENEPQQG